MTMTATRSLSAEELAAYKQDGYHIARALLSPAEVTSIRDTFMGMAANGPVPGLSEIRHSGRTTYSSADPLARYPRMMHPHRHGDKPVGPVAMRYMLDARIGAVLADLFEDEPIAAQSMFYFKPPGARGQDLHQDNFYLRVRPGTCMAAWIAIDDADMENGGMVVVPGSRRLEVACPKASDPSRFFTTEHVDVPAGMREEATVLKAGDVLFFNGSVIHGSYPNTSRTRFRRALICHYLPRSASEIAPWYRPLYAFDGTVVTRSEATGGGPCGTPQEASAPH